MIGLAIALEVALHISQRRGDGVCWWLWNIFQIITFSRLPCPSKKCHIFRLFNILGGMLHPHVERVVICLFACFPVLRPYCACYSAHLDDEGVRFWRAIVAGLHMQLQLFFFPDILDSHMSYCHVVMLVQRRRCFWIT